MIQLRDIAVFRLGNEWLFFGAGLCAGLSLLLGLFAESSWIFELFVNFIPEYVLGLSVCLAALLLYRKWLWASCLAPFLLLGACLLAPLYFPGASAAQEGHLYKLLAFNVLAWNKEADKLIDFIEQENPDFIVLTEFTAKWNRVVEKFAKRYEVRITEPHSDNFGIALMGRFKGSARIVRVQDDFGLPLPCADFILPDGKQFRLVGVHALLPASEVLREARNRALLEGAGLCHEAPAAILAGDFNMTPFSPCYSRILSKGELASATKGKGICLTCPSLGFWHLLPFSMQIDHCLMSKGLSVISWRTGPYLGSDHRPVILEFSY